MPNIFLLVITLMTTSYALYVNIPCLMVRLSRTYQGIRLAQNSQDANEAHSWLSNLLMHRFGKAGPVNRLEKFLRHSGDDRPDVVRQYVRHLALLILLPFLAAGFLKWPIWQAAFIALAGISLKNSAISRRTRQRKEALERSFFKIYRFIDNQIQAGIKPTDVLIGLHESIDDPMVQPTLVRFSARFSLTLDLDQSMMEIRHSLTGKDIETLGTHLRQVLLTGSAGRSFQRTEELLFSRYFSIMQRHSVAIRNRLLISAILMMLPTVLLFLMPVLYEAIRSLTLIFG